MDTQAKFPYASLVLWNLGNAYGTCSGSLVAPGFVLTAAHVRGRVWWGVWGGVGVGGRGGGTGWHWQKVLRVCCCQAHPAGWLMGGGSR